MKVLWTTALFTNRYQKTQNDTQNKNDIIRSYIIMATIKKFY